MKKELGRTGGAPYPGGLTNLEEKKYFQGASCTAREVSNEPETESKASVSEKIKKRQNMEDVSASSQRDMIVKLEEENVFLLKELICAQRAQTAHLQQLTASVNKLTAIISNNVMSSFCN
ncbi:uncharacterized protein LOC127864377 [Dreissena polymorpha]|uniref:Uncharacterized protein n=1 Tax=Dreissena polymorpha TaxID=45954 RepID=A0A9D4NGV2_DREPO|nr:uncharacterized protein LOC127864377 [Dreissena polymorpha]KAH3896287.1 hypothetical protein DPMN_020462 [Dreissena polymorpha]